MWSICVFQAQCDMVQEMKVRIVTVRADCTREQNFAAVLEPPVTVASGAAEGKAARECDENVEEASRVTGAARRSCLSSEDGACT